MSPAGFIKKESLSIIMLAVFFGIFSAVGPDKLWWPFIVALFGILIGIFFISIIKTEDRKNLLLIFMGGLLLRFLLSIILYDISYRMNPVFDGFFIGDGYSYSFTSWRMALMWRMGIFPDAVTISQYSGTGAPITFFEYYCAFIYFFVGKNPLVLFFINSFVGCFSAIMVYLIAKQLFGDKAALIAYSFSMFWPSLVLWSTQNLKDPMTIFLVLVSLWAMVKLRYKFKLRYILFLILSILALFLWMKVVAILLALAIFLSLLISLSIKTIIRIIIVTIVILLLTQPIGIPSALFFKIKGWLGGYSSIFRAIDHLRRARTIDANSAFLTGVNISSLPRALIFLPLGLVFLFLAPLPWQMGSLAQILAIPETLIWYILLPFTLRGIFFSLRKRWKQSSAIIIFIIAMSVTLALFEGNIGTLFRHRSIIFTLLLIFTSSGIASVKEKLS